MEKVKIDKNVCIGCGACVATSPEHFDFDDDGLAEVTNAKVNDEVKEAKDNCPTGAIDIEEDK